MSISLPYRFFSPLTTVILVAFCSSSVQAGWITIKNDTNKGVVVQENVVVNGQIKRGKPINLLPGETIREYLPAPTLKNIEVFDTQTPNQAIWSGSLNCKEETQAFSISSDNGKINVVQVNCPPKK